MDLLRARIHRTKLGEAAYVAINALLPIVLLLLVRNFDSVYPALILVLLSKWRVFALRPRFWGINIKANLVDLMVGTSIVGLMYFSMDSLPMQILLAAGYGGWLLYLKHSSKQSMVLTQAGVAQFLALTTLFSLSIFVNDLAIVAGCWIVGYATARHVVTNYEEEYTELLSCIWGLISAQLGWLLWHWTIVYDVSLPVKIPQIALIMLVGGFATARLYHASKRDRLNDSMVRVTTIFSVLMLAIILIFANWNITI